MKPLLLSLLAFAAVSCVPTPSTDPRDTSNVESRSAHGWLRIIAPKPAEFLPSKTVVVKASLRLKDSTISSVYVNGEEVEIRKGAVSVPVQLTDCNAVQRIEVWVPDTDLKANVDFYCDDIKPTIAFDAPFENGQAFVQGDRLRVRGHVEDDTLHHLMDTDPTQPQLRGRYVMVGADRSFTLDEPVTPGAQRRRLCAIDKAGHTTCRHLAAIIGNFVNTQAGAEIPRAVTLSLGQGALNPVAGYVRDVINAQNFSGMLLSLNPLVSSYSNSGALLFAINATGYEHGGIDFTAQLQNGAIYLRATVYQSRASFWFSSDIVPAASGSIYVPQITAEFYARPYAQNGRPQVELSAPNITICPNLDDCVLSMSNEFYHQVAQAPFIRQIVRDKTRETLQVELNRHAQAALQQALEVELVRDGSIAGVDARISATIDEMLVFNSVLQMIANVGIRAHHQVMSGPGALANPRRRAAPIMSPGGGVMAAAATDLINAGLYAAWSAGFFNQQLIRPDFGGESLTVAELGSLLPVPDDADPQATVRFEVSTPLPPTIRDAGVGRVSMLLPDMRVKALSSQAGGLLLFELSLALAADVAIEGNDKSVKIRPTSFTLVADPTKAEDSFPAGQTLDEIFTTLFEEDLNALLNSIGPIPIPSMPPFHIERIEPVLAPDYFAYQGNVYYSP